MIIREAEDIELDQAYMMGFTTWGSDYTEVEYLDECRASPKYKKGAWYVVEYDHRLVSSLIIYENEFNLPKQCVGIGSVATHIDYRKSGYASSLIREVTAICEKRGKEGIYLFSDIEPEFYRKLGFEPIISEQPYSESCCMVSVLNNDVSLYAHVPKYF